MILIVCIISFFLNNIKQRNTINILFFSILIVIFYLTTSYFVLFINLNFNFFLPLNLLGLSLFISGIISALMVYWLADTRIFLKKWYTVLVFPLFFFLILKLISETNYINLFLIYELFLLPSFFLVYHISPNRRSIVASIYFLTWTQFGSLLVLSAVLLLYIETQTMYLSDIVIIKSFFTKCLLFIGFSIKIPMWPYYYWLTKTHVEASSFFSIYLSGFLVKTAIYLFSLFLPIFSINTDFSYLFVFAVVGVIDSSIKMWSQTDLKKLIAYTTIQEMNLLLIPLFWNNEYSEYLVAFFIVTHCLLSSLFFFIVDILIKRYNTRVSSKITGLIHVCPMFVCFMIISILLFSGLPFTAKFFIEFLIFSYIINYDFLIGAIVLFIISWLGLIGFSKNMFNTIFGAPILFYLVLDLSKRELFIFIFLILSLVLITTSSLFIY